MAVIKNLMIRAGMDASAVSKGTKEVQKSMTQLQSSVKTSMANVNSTKKSLVGVTGALRNLSSVVKTLLPILTVFGAIRAGAKGISDSMDNEESANLFFTAFGKGATDAEDKLKKFSDALGLNYTEVMKGAGGLRVLLGNMAKTREEADSMAVELTKRASDMSSFYNVDYNTVLENLTSGMSGMGTAVKKYGINLNGAKTIQERFNIIMSQTSVANGDLERTQDSLANKTRTLKTSLAGLSQSFGDMIAPVAKVVIPVLVTLIKKLTQVFTIAAQVMNGLFGIKTESKTTGKGIANINEELDYTTDSATNAAKAIGKLAGFDELNVIGNESNSSQDDNSTGGFGGIDLGLEDQEGAINELPPKIQAMVDKIKVILEGVKSAFNNIGEGFKNAFRPEIFTLITSKISELGGNIVKFFNTPNGKILGEIGGHLANIAGLTFVATLEFINKLIEWANTSELLKDMLTGIREILKFVEWLIPKLSFVIQLITFIGGAIVDSVWVAIKGVIKFLLHDIPTAFKYMFVFAGIILKDLGTLIIKFILAPFKLVMWAIEKITGKKWVTGDLGGSNVNVPELATGGLATGATLAMIGEGKYQEAVLPLSKDVFSKLAEGIVSSIPNNNNNGPTIIQNILDGKILSETVVNNINSKILMTGKSPIFA